MNDFNVELLNPERHLCYEGWKAIEEYYSERLKNEPDSEWLYLINFEGKTKIGITKQRNPLKRIKYIFSCHLSLPRNINIYVYNARKLGLCYKSMEKYLRSYFYHDICKVAETSKRMGTISMNNGNTEVYSVSLLEIFPVIREYIERHRTDGNKKQLEFSF